MNDVIEDIQEALIHAGGGFIRHRELQNLSVRDLLMMIVPNNIKCNIEYNDKESELKSYTEIKK